MATKAEIKAVRDKIKKATLDVKYVMMRKRMASYRSLSAYSKGLIEDEYKAAVGRQMDALMELVELNLPEEEAMRITRIDTR